MEKNVCLSRRSLRIEQHIAACRRSGRATAFFVPGGSDRAVTDLPSEPSPTQSERVRNHRYGRKRHLRHRPPFEVNRSAASRPFICLQFRPSSDFCCIGTVPLLNGRWKKPSRHRSLPHPTRRPTSLRRVWVAIDLSCIPSRSLCPRNSSRFTGNTTPKRVLIRF